MNKVTIGVLATFVVIILGSGLLAYFSPNRSAQQAPATAGASASPEEHGDQNPIAELFGGTTLAPSSLSRWEGTAARITLRFAVAAFLSALLAFRPRRGLASRRNPYVAQTQILMAVVVGAMMMVVGDSAARAFGIFAAASLVRFRTNIRDPKEITVLLICLGVGLASGVGRWDMALILTLFVFVTLAVLEHFEQSQVVRSMEASVETKNVEHTNKVLMHLFSEHGFEAELCELNREDEDDPLGKIVYKVDLKSDANTSKLSEELLAVDSDNIDTIEWKQKASKTYLYN